MNLSNNKLNDTFIKSSNNLAKLDTSNNRHSEGFIRSYHQNGSVGVVQNFNRFSANPSVNCSAENAYRSPSPYDSIQNFNKYPGHPSIKSIDNTNRAPSEISSSETSSDSSTEEENKDVIDGQEEECDNSEQWDSGKPHYCCIG